MEESPKIKFNFDITKNMGRALGIGICYVKTYVGTEIYLYVNVWKYNLSIGRFIK